MGAGSARQGIDMLALGAHPLNGVDREGAPDAEEQTPRLFLP